MSDQHDSNEAFIRRLRAMRNMTVDRGASVEEAANAAAMVQRMLAERGMTLAEIAGRDTEPGAASRAEKREKTKHDRAAMYKYQRDLMEALANNNFCMYFLDEEWAMSFGKERRVKRHVLLGRESNVIGTTMTYDYLVETMDRLLPYTGMEKRGKEALIWLEGCASRLVERLNDLRRQMAAESEKKKAEEEKRRQHPAYASSGTALVTLDDVYGSEEDLNTDAQYGYEPGTTARERREREAKSAAAKAKCDALVAAGKSYDVAYWMAYCGYSEQKAIETEAASKKRDEENAKRERKNEQRRARSGGGFRSRWTNADQRDYERRNSPVFAEGRKTGDKISLNKQVGSDPAKKLR